MITQYKEGGKEEKGNGSCFNGENIIIPCPNPLLCLDYF